MGSMLSYSTHNIHLQNCWDIILLLGNFEYLQCVVLIEKMPCLDKRGPRSPPLAVRSSASAAPARVGLVPSCSVPPVVVFHGVRLVLCCCRRSCWSRPVPSHPACCCRSQKKRESQKKKNNKKITVPPPPRPVLVAVVARVCPITSHPVLLYLMEE